MLGNSSDHLFRLEDALRVRVDSLVQHAGCEIHCDRHPAQSADGDQSRQRPFKLANVALHASRNLFNNIVSNKDATLFCLSAQNCNAGFKIRR